jgi:hypothetical protein
MSKETYTIPKGPNERYNYERNAISKCSANALAWGIPDTLISRLTTAQGVYETKYDIASNRATQSPYATADRDAAWDILEVLLIKLYDQYILYNDAISDADKDSLHVHKVGFGGGKPSPAPDTAPIMTLTAEEIASLHVIYSDSSAPGTHHKPDNVAFCEVACKIGGTPPVMIDECTTRFNVPRSHDKIYFSNELRGQTVYAYGRWVNRNGKQGPWSSMAIAIIP